MYLAIKFIKFLFFMISNYLLLVMSLDIDYEQFLKDINLITNRNFSNEIILGLISFLVLSTTFIVKQILNPFIEIYIEHYYKISFYFLINMLSISTTYIVFRIYGYSRLNLIIYLIVASFAFELFDRVERKFL